MNLIFVILIAKPVFSNMYEDVFLKIGGNRNLWGKIDNHIRIDVYKYFSVSKSFLKLDLINSFEFMVAGLFIWFTIFESHKKRNEDLKMDYY